MYFIFFLLWVRVWRNLIDWTRKPWLDYKIGHQTWESPLTSLFSHLISLQITQVRNMSESLILYPWKGSSTKDHLIAQRKSPSTHSYLIHSDGCWITEGSCRKIRYLLRYFFGNLRIYNLQQFNRYLSFVSWIRKIPSSQLIRREMVRV